MLQTRRRWTAGLAGLLLAIAWYAWPAAQSGAFDPTRDFDLSGIWRWTQASPLVFEGATDDASELTVTVTDPTADRTLTVPNSTGTLVHTGSTPAFTTNITSTGSFLSSSASAGIGYATGAGCAVTQATSRTTGVTCTGISGAITTHTASLAAEATAKFTVTNTSVAIGDVVILSQRSGSNGGGTLVNVTGVAAGSFEIAVHNGNASAGTAETGAIVINFAVIKAVSS